MLRDDARVKLANKQNLYNAVRTALCLLPQEFSEEDLFLTIAGLSYHGDPRMAFFENPHKVFNIVHAQQDLFRQLYQPIIDDLPSVQYISEHQLRQEDDLKLKQQTLAKLPRHLLDQVYRQHQQRTQTHVIGDTKAFQESIIQSGHLEPYIRQTMTQIVAQPARIQSVKGVLTAGMARSLQYLKDKWSKKRKQQGISQ